jgi:hypothetical protein
LPDNLQDVADRSRAALVIIAALATEQPNQIWQYLTDAIADTSALAAEFATLCIQLAHERLDRANLAAAGLATIGAYEENEPDPLSYLRDELTAQGHDLRRGTPG